MLIAAVIGDSPAEQMKRSNAITLVEIVVVVARTHVFALAITLILFIFPCLLGVKNTPRYKGGAN
jgi:hypothetical protein